MRTFTPNFFSPRVEPLERRLCLACTIDVEDDTLSILGDAADNNVVITHDGAGNVSVVCDGEPAVLASGIKEIIVDTGDGNDVLTLDVTGELTSKLELNLDLGAGNDSADLDFATIAAKLEVEADLGAGNDLFDVNLDQEILSRGKAQVDVDGGAGDDRWNLSANEIGSKAKLQASFEGDDGNDILQAFLGDPMEAKAHVQISAEGGAGNDTLTVDATTFGTGADIADGAKLQVHLEGGDGDDTLNSSYEGEVAGMLQLHLSGGEGNDAAVVNATTDVSGKGKVQIHVNGDAGDDALTLNLTSTGNSKHVQAAIDGGLGMDTCVATPNVKKRNCEA
jgi:hypothetical protein